MYQDIYELCLNTEKVMQMYSKELQMLDKNTVHYMINELQSERGKAKEQERIRRLEAQFRAHGIIPD